MTTITVNFAPPYPVSIVMQSIYRVADHAQVNIDSPNFTGPDGSGNYTFAFTPLSPIPDVYNYAFLATFPDTSNDSEVRSITSAEQSPPAGLVYARESDAPRPDGTIATAPIFCRLVTPQPGDGIAYDGSIFQTTPDSLGRFNLTLFANAEYELWYGRGLRRRLITTTTSPVTIPDLSSRDF